MKYLPTEELKNAYEDVLEIISTNSSDKIKIGAIRPLIEAFLNYENKTIENDKIRLAIKQWKENNNKNSIDFPDELFSAFHKILDDTSKGLHVKQEKLNNEPRNILSFIEAIFIKLYLIPIKQKKLQEDFEEEKQKINSILEEKINLIK